VTCLPPRVDNPCYGPGFSQHTYIMMLIAIVIQVMSYELADKVVGLHVPSSTHYWYLLIASIKSLYSGAESVCILSPLQNNICM